MTTPQPAKHLATTNALLSQFDAALGKGDRLEVESVVHEILAFKETVLPSDVFSFICQVFVQALKKGDPDFLKMVWDVPMDGAREAMLVRYFLKDKEPSMALCTFILNQFTPESWTESWLSSLKILSSLDPQKALLGFHRLDQCMALSLSEEIQRQYLEQFQTKIAHPDEYIPDDLFPETKIALARHALAGSLPHVTLPKKNEPRL